MNQGRKSPKKVRSSSEKSADLSVNGGRLYNRAIPYSQLSKLTSQPSTRALHKNLHQHYQQGITRPFTAHPTAGISYNNSESGSSGTSNQQQGVSTTKSFRSAGQLRSNDKKLVKPQALPNLQMAPLTVPLLPVTGTKTISSFNKRSPSPLRSRVPSHYPHVKNILGPDSIHLLRPNNTLVELHKIDLDRKGYTAWPAYVGTDPPRLLSLQHNLLTRLDPPTQLPSLVLLDLYHNHIKSLEGLHAMPNLRILLLAKNRLTRLDGLESLTKLEVLDLHGNQLHNLCHLSHLKDLRLLNLAGNMLRHVTGLRGLDSLAELNLKRNLIRTVADLNLLPRLEKVFLSYNEIYRYEDIASLQKCSKLRELSLSENPISKQPLYYHTAILKFYRLKRLDEQELTIENRRISERILQKAKEKERAKAAQITDEERRKSAINSAMKHWKTLKSRQYMIIGKSNDSSEEDSSSDSMKDGEEDDDDSRYSHGEEKTDGNESPDLKKEGKDKNANDEPKRDVPIIHETMEEESSESVALSSDGSQQEQECLHDDSPKTCLQVPSQDFVPKRKCEFIRSQSSVDIKVTSPKVDNVPTHKFRRPKSGVDSGHRHIFHNKHLTPNNANNFLLRADNADDRFKNSVKTVIRRHSESRLNSVGRNKDDLGGGGFYNTANKILQKTESAANLRTLPDRVLTAAVSKIQSNLHRLHNNVDAKHTLERIMNNKFKVNINPEKRDFNSSDTSEADSDTDTASTFSNANLENESGKTPFSQLRIPFSKNRHFIKNEIALATLERIPQVVGILREQGPNFLAELEGKVLRLYGNGALKCTELGWEKAATMSAATVHFQYINYDDITDSFPRLRVRFPHLENFVFIETNLTKCSQLNALAELHQVNSIYIKRDGNPLIDDPITRLYAIFRLTHWGLASINGVEINEGERQEASYLFSPLSQLAFTCLPRHQLNALISARPQHSPNSINNNNNNHENEGLVKEEDEEESSSEGPRLNASHLQELIGKEALQYRPTSKLSKEEIISLTEAGLSMKSLMKWALDSVNRLQRLEEAWPTVLHELTRDSITDIIKPNYGKICLDSLKKELGWKK